MVVPSAVAVLGVTDSPPSVTNYLSRPSRLEGSTMGLRVA